MRYRAQLADTVALTAASAVRAASQWGLIIVVSVTGGPSLVGQLAFALAVSTPIFVLSELALRNVFVTLQARYRYFAYLRIRATANLAAAALAMAATCFPSGPDAAVMAALVAAKWADSSLDILYASLQHRGRIQSVAASMAINGVLILLLFSAMLVTSKSLSVAILGWAAGSGIVAGVVGRMVFRVERRADSELMGGGTTAILRAGTASGVAQSVNSLQTYVPVLLLSLWSSESDAGVFVTVGYFVTIANLILASALQASLPRVVANNRLSRDAWNRSTRTFASGFLIVGAALAVLTFTWGRQAVELIYGPEFRVSANVLTPIALIVLILPLIYISSMALLVANRYVTQVKIAAWALLGTVLVALVLHREFGVVEAAWVLLLGTAVRSALGICAVASGRGGQNGRAPTTSRPPTHSAAG